MALSHPLDSFPLKNESTQPSVHRLLLYFLMGFALIYTVFPFLFYQSVFPDSAQNITWGHYLGWSYHRHPPLGTWLISFMDGLFADHQIAAFVSSVLCLSVSLLFIYKLSSRYLAPKEALLACVFSSLTLYFLTNFVLQFNQNSIMLPFWVMVAYFSDKCMAENRWSDWLLLGMVAALGMLAKYETLLLIALAFGYLLIHFRRDYLPKLIGAFVLFVLFLMPHLIAIFSKGATTIDTLHEKFLVNPPHGFLYLHSVYPFQALLQQLGHLLPAVLLLLFFFKTQQQSFEGSFENKGRFNFLSYLGWSPLLLVVFISLVFGLKIQPEWGFPLFAFSLPAIIAYYDLKIKPAYLTRLVILALVFHAGSLFAYKAIQFYISKPTRTSYPSQALAQKASSYWHEFTDQPIRYIGGEEVIYYYLGAYLPDKPLLLEHNSFKESPWVKEEEVKKQGILLVMEGCDEMKNEALKAQFSAKAYRCIDLPYSNKYARYYRSITLMVAPPKDHSLVVK